MIELAPANKVGLPLANPVLIAAGGGDYGNAYRNLVDLAAFGGLITGPITLRPRQGRPAPRLVETRAGLILDTGQQNPGVKKVLQLYRRLWRNLPLPVIALLPAEEPVDLQRTVRALTGTAAITAIELEIPEIASAMDIQVWVRTIREVSILPLLIKFPLRVSLDKIDEALSAGADALVFSTPPLASAPAAGGQGLISGYWYGPAMLPLFLYEVQTMARHINVPLIVGGGVHTLAEARLLLEAGATAIQLDSLLWVDPHQAETIARSISAMDVP